MSVDYGSDGVRSRIACQVLYKNGMVAGDLKILQFPIRIPVPGTSAEFVSRIDTFDYDFDILVNDEDDLTLPTGIYILLSSGRRPSGDNSSFAEVLGSPVMSLLCFDENLGCVEYTSWNGANWTYEGQHCAISSPKLFKTVTTVSDNDHAVLVSAYLNRHGSSLDEVASGKAAIDASFLLFAAHSLAGPVSFPVDLSTYELRGTAGSGSGSMNFVMRSKSGVTITSAQFGGFNPLHVAFGTTITLDADIEDAVPWPGRLSFLAVRDGILHELSVSNGGVESTQVGPSDRKMTTFRISSDGNMLIFAENVEGKGGQRFAEKSGEPGEAEMVDRHYLVGSIFADGLFSQVFPIAEMEHSIDSLSNISTDATEGAYAFTYSVITDISQSKADVRYAEVPTLVAATPLSLVADNVFVLAGSKEEPFTMTIRNDGNTILRGCCVEFRDCDTRGLVNRKDYFAFSSDNICASPWNPELYESGLEDAADFEQRYPSEALAATGVEGFHLLADPVSAGVLLPGSTATYRIKFPIPGDWRGDKKTYLVLKDFDYVVPTVGLAEQRDDSALQYSLPEGECPTCDLTVHDDVEAFGAGLGDAVMFKNDAPLSSGNVGGTADKDAASEGGSGGSDLNKTGDATGLAALGLVAAAAAGGFAAYSARRHMLERSGEREEDSGE